MRQTGLYHSVTTQPEPVMGKQLQCGDVVAGCKATFAAESEEEILKQVAEHAAHAHGVTDVSPELLGKVRSAIRES
jgi:predicted small metal-binding protein